MLLSSLLLTARRMGASAVVGIANGQATMLGAYDASGIQLGKMSAPAACANAFTPVGSPFTGAAIAFEPVQLGNKPALLYIDASNRMKVYVP